MKEDKMPLIIKYIIWLKLAWQWRYLTDKTGFLFIGTHCIVTWRWYCVNFGKRRHNTNGSSLSPSERWKVVVDWPPDDMLTRCWSRTSCRMQQPSETSLSLWTNARPQRARVADQFLEENGIERMEWPAKSPGCNLIENLWDNIKRRKANKIEGEGRYLFGGIPAQFAEGLGQPGSTSHTNFDQQYADEVSRGDRSRWWTYHLLNTSFIVRLIKSKT